MTRLTKKSIELWKSRAGIAQKDPWYWLQYFVLTKDEHDQSVMYKPFPPKAIYRFLCRAIREFDVIFIEKSRQVMVSWFFASITLWMALFMFNVLAFLQSKKQEDADKLLNRARHIYDGIIKEIEPIIGRWLPRVKRTGVKSGTNTEMEFVGKGSIIHSIPQGPEIVRSHTPTIIFADEGNHQPKFEEGLDAAQPGIQGGGKYWTVGTPNGKINLYLIIKGIDKRTRKSIGAHLIDSRKCENKLPNPPEGLTLEAKRYWIEKYLLNMSDEEFDSMPFAQLAAMFPGVNYHRTAAYSDCLSIHYTADPDKDPITKTGKEWFTTARRKFKTQAAWDKEYELDYESYNDRPVILNWDKNIFVKKLIYDPEYPIRMSFDFGTIKNVVIFFQYIKIPDYDAMQMCILQELVLDNSNTPEQAQESANILERDYPAAWNNNNLRAYCDPNGDRQEETVSDKSLNTSIKILRTSGIYPTNRRFGTPESTQLIETVFATTLADGKPAILIDESCKYIQECCKLLRYPENGRPGYYEKDGVYDHGGDVLRYAIANCFTQYDLTGKERKKIDRQRPIYEDYTGRLVGYKDSSLSVHRARRGEHRVHAV